MSQILAAHGIRNALIFIGVIADMAGLVLFLAS